MKNSPDTLGVIQARLAYLYSRKTALDELISCLEQYAAISPPSPLMPAGTEAADETGDFLGAA